jgi:hypothetical protein
MAKSSSERVSWTSFNTVVTVLLTAAVAVVGWGSAWVLSDVGDIRTDVREIRGSVATISNRIQDTREDMLKAVSQLEKQAAVTNVKLDELTSATRKGH